MIRYPLDYNPILHYMEQIRSGNEVVSAKVRKTYEWLEHKVLNPDEYFYSAKRANHVIECCL